MLAGAEVLVLAVMVVLRPASRKLVLAPQNLAVTTEVPLTECLASTQHELASQDSPVQAVVVVTLPAFEVLAMRRV